ncbi:hypothetical protein [Nonomuraea glycinis]|uniref:hypothetical protein n=1 Tax=Nonomuraea glycinis TaxID=2047744 RepID=UPI0033AFBAB2
MKSLNAVLLTLLLFLVPIAGSGPAAGQRLPLPPVLDVHVTQEGFTVPGPNPRPGGPVTFRVTAEGAAGYWWTAYKLRGDTTLPQFVEWMEQSASPDPAVALPALRSLYDNVDYSGGAKIHPGDTVELTQTLTPGIYYFGSQVAWGEQARSAGAAADPSPFGWLEVTDEVAPARSPSIDGVVYMGRIRNRNVIVAPASAPADGRLLVRNDTDQPQEVMFLELAPGATDRDIQEYFDAELEGRPLPPRPFYDSVGGMLALSPGKQLVLMTGLPPGRYGIFSWLRVPETGIDSAALGMHKVITLR